jgi:tRNA(Ile)-lysidine synthase
MIIQPTHLKNLLSKTDECVLGVSGGLDSMCLMDWFYRNPEHVPKWRVIHVNHNISPDSGKWAQHVMDECAKRDVACEVIEVDISGRGNNLEYAARQARYEAFALQPENNIVLAHHQNDQIETFFLKLFRGSGIKGLRGMSAKCASWFNNRQMVIRPMLENSRVQLEHYAEQYDIKFCEDPSNEDRSFDRNWIRKLLWPVIDQRFGMADVNIQRCMRFLSENWELTQELAALDLTTVKINETELDWTKLNKMSALRIKNVLLHIMDLRNLVGFSTHQVELWAKAILNSDVNSKTELRVNGLRIIKKGNKLILQDAGSIIQQQQDYD